MAAGTTAAEASIPFVSDDNSVWADVSPLLQHACNGLQDGELVHGDNFNLYAAMSALEIMDPKMDSGMIGKYYSVDEAIECGAAPVPISFDKTVDVQCSIDIMDHLLACEEEDHFTMTYGLNLNGEDEKCLSILSAVEETISRQLRACRAPSSGRKSLEDIEPLQTNPGLEDGYCRSILERLRFRKHFYHILMCLKRPQGRGMHLARRHIASCISELKAISKSSRQQTVLEDRITAPGRQPIGFDSSLNARLSAPTPPRSINILSCSEAIEYFLKLLQDLDIISSCSLDNSLEGILRFIVQFQKSQPDLVARAHLQCLLLQDGKLFGRNTIFSVITKAAGLSEVAKNIDIESLECIVQLGQLVMNLLRILCTNSAWQRRKLGKILQDWRVIYMQLELAVRSKLGEASGAHSNENICMNTLNQILIWVEEQTYWIASRFLMLGFELELYSPSEYGMVYWYIYVVSVKLVEKMHHRMSINNIVKCRGKKKRVSGKDAPRDIQFPPTVLFLQSQICLAEGLAMMLAALRNEKTILECQTPFNTDQERFFQHFELLQKAGIPDHISYQSFEGSTKNVTFSSLAMYNHFKDAQRIVKEVKSSFSDDPERLSDLRRVEQVAEHNSIALSLLCRMGGSLDPSLKLSFEFSHHPHFATAVVRRSL